MDNSAGGDDSGLYTRTFTRSLDAVSSRFPEISPFPIRSCKLRVTGFSDQRKYSRARNQIQFGPSPSDVLEAGFLFSLIPFQKIPRSRTDPIGRDNPTGISVSGGPDNYKFGILTTSELVNSFDVFMDSSVPPYYLEPQDLRVLSDPTCSKFVQGPSSATRRALASNLSSVLLTYYFRSERPQEYRRVFRSQPKQSSFTPGREPTIFRITSRAICDDLGRIYTREKLNEPFVFQQYKLSLLYKCRDHISILGHDGYRLFKPSYLFVGLAGYPPELQHKFAFSYTYDIHHTGENKFDIRPESLIPLPKHVHHYVHTSDWAPDALAFFDMNDTLNPSLPPPTKRSVSTRHSQKAPPDHPATKMFLL